MAKEINERLDVNWDSYWKGFMSNPLIEVVRFNLIRRACERLLRTFSSESRPKFCELGAGTGSISRFFGDKYKADIAIVDSNPMALELSREVFKDFVHHFQSINRDVFNLKDFAGQFDLVHSGGLIEHFIGTARSEIIKVHCDLVKPGGYILILVPIHNGWYRILNEGIFKFLHLLDHIPEVPWSLSELSGQLDQYGFQIVAQTTVITELGILAKRK